MAVSSLKDLAIQQIKKVNLLYIGGEWVPSVSGETLDALNPSTEEKIAVIQLGAKEDVDLAVRAARKALEEGPWSKMSAKQRSVLLWKLSDLLEARLDEFAALETLDNGAPVAFTRGMLFHSINVLRHFAGAATRIYGVSTDISDENSEFHSYTRSEPVGVCGFITPWNVPLTMVVHKIAPALAAGCTCILKPAELTSLTALHFMHLIEEAGFPPGVVNVVTGKGTVVGEALGLHRGVDKISFTGSTGVGKHLINSAATNLKRITLELGGKSPHIICEDANLDEAIPTAAMAIYTNSGQVCVAGSRLYVHSKIYDKFMEGLAAYSEKFVVGDGFDANTSVGPLISAQQQQRVMDYIQSGKKDGASVLAGGDSVGDKGYFVKPTIFANANPNAKIVREEIFGPVVVANKFSDYDEVVKLANDTNYGLAAGISTSNVGTAHRLAKKLQAGSVWINTYMVLDPALPFGGYKESGWGRELGQDGIESFLEKKTIFTRL